MHKCKDLHPHLVETLPAFDWNHITEQAPVTTGAKEGANLVAPGDIQSSWEPICFKCDTAVLLLL